MTTDRGVELNKRVWSLFERAGFKTKPNSHSPNEEKVTLAAGRERSLDLSAEIAALDIKIIGENTSEANLRESFTTYIHDIQQLITHANAKAGLYVLTQAEVTEENRRYAEENNIKVWGEKELRYFEAVVDALGIYAKYEIIHSFGLRTAEETHIHNLVALKFKQPFRDSNANLFMFTIPPEKLLRTCVIYRKAQGSGDAYQRMVNKARLSSVKKYVTRENAVLPPNLIVYLNDNVSWTPIPIPERDARGNTLNLARGRDYELGILSIPLEYASIELIDGQHRLYGFVGAEQATRENFNLAVMGLKNLSNKTKRETFIAINDNMRRVDANLVTYLKYTDNEGDCQGNNELMAIKIVVELNKLTPFKDKIKLLDIGEQVLTLKNFSNYDLQSLLSTRGLLRRYYPSNESSEYIRVLRLYFGILQSYFRHQWQNPDKYINCTNRGISAFLKLLKSILRNCQSPLDAEIIKRYIQPIKDRWGDEKWEKDRLKGVYIGAAGRKKFQRDLVSSIKQDYPEFKE